MQAKNKIFKHKKKNLGRWAVQLKILKPKTYNHHDTGLVVQCVRADQICGFSFLHCKKWFALIGLSTNCFGNKQFNILPSRLTHLVLFQDWNALSCMCSWISLSIFQQNLNGYRTPPQWKLKKEGEHCIISEYELEINKTKSHVHFYSFLCFGDLSISHSRPGLPKYYSYHTACGLPCMCLIHSLL